MSRDGIRQERWLAAWRAFDTLYTPHAEELHTLIRSRAERFEQTYDALDDSEEREQFIGHGYNSAKRFGLPLSLVDWWRTLQVSWVPGENEHNLEQLPDALPYQPERMLKHRVHALREFRRALAADDGSEDAAFLASMLEAIRLAEAQRRMYAELRS